MNAIKSYQLINCLYQGSKTEVYRAICTDNQLAVVIKFLRNEYPSFSELVQFRNQYTIAKNLEIPGIVKPLALEAYRTSYALVMEDWGGISLRYYIKEHFLSLSELLDIAIQITDILQGLYQHRVIHKDIKPANILIHPESKQVKLIDFSIASLLPKETEEVKHPNVLEGTLAYLAPEQTGRMNRGVDYRTDFYSWGVTLFELLAGVLPFPATDPLELIHCHIAKPAPNLCEIKPEIPQQIGQIVAKLMAKNPEERYQSASGLKYDLEICLHQLQETDKIAFFKLGQKDISDRFIIPEKLYGRETEVKTLLEAFDRVANPPQPGQPRGDCPYSNEGRSSVVPPLVGAVDGAGPPWLGGVELMLVAGFSGIGKTAVINEIHKPIVRQRGYFIKGKFDQFNRNIPLSAFVRAFRDLMGQLLSESDAQLQSWQSEILKILGENAQVIIDVIPDLETIIGAQPPVPKLSGTAAQNRFNLLFQKFIQIFAKPEHPLVIFLDDLQWADAASLNLMELLMASETGCLLLLGAYRDNEVFAAHPLMLTLDAVRKAGAIMNSITLQPLSTASLNQLVADTLKCDRKLAQPLTELIARKTQGNPFFATQFLKALHQDGLIAFKPPTSLYKAGYWQCDIVRVREAALTDDVVEFMALQLQKLPPATQEILKLAACIGNQFDLQTLAIVSEKSSVEAAASLWSALQEGLVLPITEIYKFFQSTETEVAADDRISVPYKFLHDRVQQAAYSLIPENQKQATHLKIGQLLQQNLSEIEKEEQLFDIVGHLNLAQNLIAEAGEREALARLNLAAGQKARNSTAYAAARSFVQTGLDLLAAKCWQTQYELTLNLYVAATETAYLNADFEDMEAMAAQVLRSAQTILDKVKIYEIQINALTAQSQMLEAIAVGKNSLAQLGVEFSSEPDEALTDKALQTVAEQLQGKQIEELVDLAVMCDREKIAAMQLLAILFLPISIGSPDLLPLHCSTMVSLSLQFGNAPASTIGYAGYGMVLSAFLGEVERGYCFGRVALSLVDRLNVREFKCLTLLLFGYFLQHHQEALRATIPTTKEGYLAGMETGDFLYAGYSIDNYFDDNFFSGVSLDAWEAEIENYCVVLAQVKQDSPLAYIKMKQQMAHNLLEIVDRPDLLIGTAYNETVMFPKHHEDSELTALATVYIYKLVLAYLFGNYTNARDYIAQANLYMTAVAGAIHTPIFHFYAGLTYLAQCSAQSKIEPTDTLALLETHQTTLALWANHAPMNHRHKLDLVEAEKSRVLGKNYEAGDWYDRAISGAKTNGYIQEEALANELAAKFYLNWGKEKVAAGYMQEAYYCYARWGASSKVLDLETLYPQLLSPILQRAQMGDISPLTTSVNTIVSLHETVSSSSTSVSNLLDIGTVLKVAEALYSEIHLDKLLATVMQVIIKNSGADKAALFLARDGELEVVIKYLDNTIVNFFPKPLDECQYFPTAVVHYVERTLETLITDVKIPKSIQSDSYFIEHQPQSLLCTPILNQGKLIGVLYLENSLTKGAFTPERVELLKLLCSQAAISLANARLYQQSQTYAQQVSQKSQQLEQTLQELQTMQLQLVQNEKMSALGNLVAGVAHEINNPVGFLAGNIQPALDYIKDLLGLLDLYQEKYPQIDPEIEDEIEAIDLEFVRKDLPKLVGSMREGVDRITDISTSLRTFSRADSDTPVAFNLHEGIDSTLLILKHRLKANENRPEIKVIKNYGQIPKVECFAGQLNQVFMNILANAIDALEESNQGRSFAEIQAHPNQITIRTMLEGNCVKIAIADNGKGMTAEVKSRIFDHLFTTKEVGKGTGLGLAIARQILVEKHSSTIEVSSILGEGAEFTISIPC